MDKLKLRNAMKKRKPTFERQYANVMKQFKGKWNRPRGMHSKMRKGYRGKKLLPAVGFRSPVEVRGLTRTGLVVFVVHNTAELKNADVKKHSVVLASGLGTRKKVEILNKAIELKIPVFNVKDSVKFIEESKKELTERKKLSSDRKTKKDKKKQEKTDKETKEKAKEDKKEEKKSEFAKAENKKEVKIDEKKTENIMNTEKLEVAKK